MNVQSIYFPPPGRGLLLQARRNPTDLGLSAALLDRLDRQIRSNPVPDRTQRWALWRWGYLVHVEGDFDKPIDVYSLRKTWHALTVGAAIGQNRIPSIDQKLSVWQTELEGNHADATWRHVITQSSCFDYPYGSHPAYRPGEMWTYSDMNPFHLCHALAKVYGRRDFYDDYQQVAAAAYFDAIGMEGWGTCIHFDTLSQMDDGVRFLLSLEHMGRLGLLVLARGRWQGRQLIPQAFVEALERKQTYGMSVNYEGPCDGKTHLHAYADRFPECPYGYMTWVNTDGDYFPGADSAWAFGAGAGGNYTLWNFNLGIVFAAHGIQMDPLAKSVPQCIEQGVI